MRYGDRRSGLDSQELGIIGFELEMVVGVLCSSGVSLPQLFNMPEEESTQGLGIS